MALLAEQHLQYTESAYYQYAAAPAQYVHLPMLPYSRFKGTGGAQTDEPKQLLCM